MCPFGGIVCRKDVEDWVKRGLWKEITEAESEALKVNEPVAAEVWPKWFIRCPCTKTNWTQIAYSRQDSENSGETFYLNGESYKWKENVPDGWIEVAEAEAKSRLTPKPSLCVMCGVNQVTLGVRRAKSVMSTPWMR